MRDVKIFHKKALKLQHDGRKEEAVVYFDKVLETEPRDSNVLLNKGLALAHLGRYDEAIAYFDTVLEDEPDNLFALEWKKEAIRAQNKNLMF